MRYALAAFVALVILGAPATALGMPISGATQPEADHINVWLGKSKMPLPPGLTVGVVDRCPGDDGPYARRTGCTVPLPGQPVYVAHGFVTWAEVYHEVGHQYAQSIPAGAVHRFGTLTGRAQVARTDENLADAYMLCARGVKRGRVDAVGWVAGYSYEPSPTIHRQVCGMLSRALSRS